MKTLFTRIVEIWVVFSLLLEYMDAYTKVTAE
jgi:hypothetical protein